MLGVEKLVFTPRVSTSMAIENIAFDYLRNQFLGRFSDQLGVTDASNSLAACERMRQMRFFGAGKLAHWRCRGSYRP
jgi:hypothetical protein